MHTPKRMAVVAALIGLLMLPATASAVATSVNLGTAREFAVLGGSTLTNTGPTVVTGDLGVSPGLSVTGFPPGIVLGTILAGDAVAAQAQDDVTTAYNDAAGQAPDVAIAGNLGGLSLTPGVYAAATSIGLTGTLTLDAQGDPDAVWVFQVGSTLTTASASSVSLIDGAQACNVFWQVGSSATLGTGTSFVGTILALTSITLTTGATIDGRALARNGAVTMDTNVITRSDCAAAPEPTPTATASPTASATAGPTPSPTPAGTEPTPTATPAPSTELAAAPEPTNDAPVALTAPTPPPTDVAAAETSPASRTGLFAVLAGIFILGLASTALRPPARR